jgi:ATP-dependent Clp protease ATP-binding subunit ClpA
MSTGEQAQQVFRAAAEEADAWKHHDIWLAQLLLGVLRHRGSKATTLLDRTGIRLESVRDGIAVLLNGEPL